jgi:hypothetical protein
METLNLSWWIQVIELPVLTGLFLWIIKLKSQIDLSLEKLRGAFSQTLDRIQKELSDYKLEVARTYASMSYLKDVEDRLTNHLLRIEKKLEQGEKR